MENMCVSEIHIGTEELPMEEGGTRAVSTIEITLTAETKSKEDAKAAEATEELA